MGVITNSPDLGYLEVLVRYDLSGATPVIYLTNQSTANPNVSPVPNLSSLIWVLNIYSPTGTPIFQSDFTTPWKPAGQGAWTTATLDNTNAPWPRPFNQIEWSDYRVEFQVKDTVGTIYDLFKSTEICRPAGSSKNYQDTYGHVKLVVETLCERSSLYIQDTDSKLYQGIEGVNQSSYLAVDYPRDATGTLPAPYVLTTFITDALLPFYQNGEHEATYYSVWRYDLGDNVFIDIRYTAQVAFATQCNIDLCPIACEIAALESSIENGSCANVADAERKLKKVSSRLLRAFIGKQYPSCGIDVAKLVEEIKTIGGFTCDCNVGSSGIGTTGTAIPPFIFTVNNQGGDIIGSFSVTDGNVVLNLKDKSYTFTQGSGAIQLLTAVGATNNTISLSINIDDLAEDIYQATAASASLQNLFCQLSAMCGGGGGGTITIDGKCIISNNACDIEWVMAGITGSNATITFLQVAGVYEVLNFIFNTGNLVALQTYLNTLGFGTFVVTSLGGGQIQIATTANTFNLGDIIYRDSSGSNVKKTAVVTRNCNALAALTESQIIQAIIDWLCPLGDEKVYTSEDYSICYVDPVTKAKTIETVPAASLLPTFFQALMNRGCNTVDFIMSLKSVNCASIQALFTPSAATMGANDWFMGTKQGFCARIGPVEAGTRQLQLGAYDQDFITAFCTLVQICGGGQICQPYNLFTVTPVLDSPSSNLMALIVTFTHPDAVASNIRYARIDQGGELNWSEPAYVLAGASPYAIHSIDEGQYTVGITPVYADGRLCGEVQKSTDVCGAISSMSAVYNGTNIVVTYAATSEKVRIRVQYPNGGQFIGVYAAGASPVSIAPPEGVTGIFSVYIQSVCNEATAWYGPVSAPSVFEITPANNSTITNNSSIALSSVLVSVTDEIGGSTLISNTTSLPVSGVANFYLADGTYPTINLVSLSTSIGWTAYLVTGSGTYTLDGSNNFNNVVASGGVQIVILDSSPV